MPQPVSRSSSLPRITNDFTNRTGYTGAGPQSPTTQNANPPILNPPMLLGVDVVNYTFDAAGTQYITFSHIVSRNNRANPLNPKLQTAGQQLTIRPQDKIILIVVNQGVTNISVLGEGYDKNNISCPGPFLGGNTYTRFGARLTAQGACSGSVVGQLFFQPGT